ncbi:hypothetical protein E4T48_06933 [Aureobasidium sp. EXF-10727]|nr:hypothetical protein E4T48_06933 [Aureobasidium sp. EXF-10727]
MSLYLKTRLSRVLTTSSSTNPPPAHPGAAPSPRTGALPPPSGTADLESPTHHLLTTGTGPFAPFQQAPHNILNPPSPRHQAQAAFPLGREMPDHRDNIHIKEEQDAVRRDQQRERQHMEQLPPHQAQRGPIHLHQPVAVPPNAVHGPNGLLANAAGGHGQVPNAVFSGGPVQSATPAQAMQAMLVPMQSGSAQPANVGQGQQPILNDALSYLDQVKVQFVDHPDVYNRFLDIMKDFKSGAYVSASTSDSSEVLTGYSIDTPGVIERVSTLFAGNPELIQGFNTFLPPGYRIECGTGDDPNAIRVTTPMGTTVQAMPAPRPISPRAAAPTQDGNNQEGPLFAAVNRQANGNWTPQAAAHSHIVHSPSGRPVGTAPFTSQMGPQQAAAIAEAQAREQQALSLQQEQRVSQLQNAVSAAAGDNLARAGMMSPNGGAAALAQGEMVIGPDGQPLGHEKVRPQVEFNHAISYVNKIKNRFQQQPDIYKQFLEILQTYQRESKPIQDVYAQVTRLFNSAPDLLEDFKQFLPESAAHAKAAAAARAQQQEESVMLSNVRGDPFYQAPQPHQTPRAEHRLPPVGNFAPTPTVNKDNKRKRGDRQGTVTNAGPETNGLAKAPAYGQMTNVNKRAKQAHAGRQAMPSDIPPTSPTLVPALPEPLPPTQSTLATADEMSFFDRAKKAIGNKAAMNEFLKLCNLFSQDLIDKVTLVHKARGFIGSNPDLFQWFQMWVGYNNDDITIENKPRAPQSRISLSNCRGLGPSYRLLPKRERLKPCRGRDELCNEVLNDDWASHPTWASEDSGFIAHRKNVHEEGLHKIEEERHDYDFNIEACSRTIQLLEPIAQQILRMNNREKEALEIPPGLGGQSETIHKRIIMKLYGREKGHMVVQSLHAQPYKVIPVLLNRLKQKLEEWKQAQREWEKVWRDQTQKMFWKSLDHQAVNAKQADKRQFQTKTLLGEVHTRYEETKRQRLAGQNPRNQPQMTFKFEDTSVIIDTSHLVLLYAEQMHSTEFPRLTSFIREFIPLFFGLDFEWFGNQIRAKFGDTPHMDVGEDAISAFDDPINAKPRKPTTKKGDLLRGVLERGRKNRKDDGSNTPLSRASTPDNASNVDEEMSDSVNVVDDLKSDIALDTWASHPLAGNVHKDKELYLNQPYSRTKFMLYGNATIYCFIRVFIFLYERLNNIKQAEADAHTTVDRAMAPKPATELGIIDKLPTDFFTDVSESSNFYRQILGMFEDLIKGDMDMAHIEETLRRYYLQCGWQLYSFDKLLGALVRFAIGMLGSESGKDKSWDILQLFRKDRAKDETSFQDEMNYRKQTEKYTKDLDIYGISFVRDVPNLVYEHLLTDVQDQATSEVQIRLYKKDDPTFDTTSMLQEDLWRVYVTNLLKLAPTPDVPATRRRPVMHRNLRQLNVDPSTINSEERSDEYRRLCDSAISSEGLEFRVAVEFYRMYFVKSTEEYAYQPAAIRSGGKEGVEEADSTARYRSDRSQDTFVINNAAMKGLSKEDVEGKNSGFGALVREGGVTVSSGSADEDEEMDD